MSYLDEEREREPVLRGHVTEYLAFPPNLCLSPLAFLALGTEDRIVTHGIVESLDELPGND